MNRGTLIVRPLSAKLTYNTEWFARMDPYAVCTIGGTINKTATSWNTGKNPSWQDTLNFRVNGDPLMHVAVYDKDNVTRDDYIGEGVVSLLQIYNTRNSNQWINLKRRNGKPAGQIMISFEFYPEGGMANANQMGYGMAPQIGMNPPIGYGMAPQMGMNPPMGYGMAPPISYGMAPQMSYGMGPLIGMQSPVGQGMQPSMGMGIQSPMGIGMGMQSPIGMGMQPPMGISYRGMNQGMPPGFF